MPQDGDITHRPDPVPADVRGDLAATGSRRPSAGQTRCHRATAPPVPVSR